LKNFQADIIIHIGELIMTSTKAGGLQSPWGRTTSSEFQVGLAEQFNCVITAKLPGFPFSEDYITVWSRSKFIEIEESDDDDDDDDDDDAEEDVDPLIWRVIARDEALPDLTRASPKYQHLL
jgi:hypothetical protein